MRNTTGMGGAAEVVNYHSSAWRGDSGGGFL